jgi:hypothetical protein
MIGCQQPYIVPSFNELNQESDMKIIRTIQAYFLAVNSWAHTADVLSVTTRSRTRSAEINLHTFGVVGKPELLSQAATRLFCIGRH